jgi:hypothetical protein
VYVQLTHRLKSLVTGQGAIAIAKGLVHNATLTHLDLCSCGVGSHAPACSGELLASQDALHQVCGGGVAVSKPRGEYLPPGPPPLQAALGAGAGAQGSGMG